MTIAVGPLVTVDVVIVVVAPLLLRATTQPPAMPGAVQSWVSPKKKKSVPPLTLGLKNSVHSVQRAAAEVRSCALNEMVVFMVRPVNPKAYCQGVVSASPVPQRRISPFEGVLKYWLVKAGSQRKSAGTGVLTAEPGPRRAFDNS